MKNFFNPENPVFIFINKLVSAAYLNILWLLCSLPIVTIGASTTALFTVTLKMAKNEEGNVTSQFFQAFKANFKQSTIVSLILLVLGGFLAVDAYTLYHLRFENIFWTVITAIFLVLTVAYCIVLMYIFPLMAYFENTIPAMFKNSIMIGMRFLICTAVMAFIYFLMALIIVRFFTPALVFGEGLCAYLCSHLLSNVFALCEPKEEAETDAKPLS